MTQISSATSVAVSVCRDRGATPITLSRRCTLLTLNYHLETKTKIGLLTKCAKPVLKLFDQGKECYAEVRYQWFGENQQTIWITATSKLSM